MVKRPTHQRTFRAQPEFTDREASRSLFVNALDDRQPHEVRDGGPSPYRVLVFYGVGGQGKTSLYEHFDDQLTAWTKVRQSEGGQRLAHVVLDFEEDKGGRFLNPVEVLLRLRIALKARGGFSCPHFDVAFARYFALTRPGVSIRDAYPELFRSQSELVSDAVGIAEKVFGKLPEDVLNDIVDTAGDTLSDVPGWGFLFKHANRWRERSREWWERTGLTLLENLDDKKAPQLLQDLPMYLGADLTRAQAQNPKLRLVILLDTYEFLWRDTHKRGYSYLTDDYLKRLITESPGVLFTIFGRDKIRWGESDEDWADMLNQHRLGGLSDEDGDLFLLRAGVEEEHIRRVVVASSKGGAPDEKAACLPFYLDLQLKQYEEDRNDNRELRPERYGGTHPEIIERFLKPPYTDHVALQTLMVMTCAWALTREGYDALSHAFLPNHVLPYLELLSYSFVNDQDGQLTMHALMREYLQAKHLNDDPARFKAVHEWLFENYDELAQPVSVLQVSPQHELALRDAAFHKELVDPPGFASWCADRCRIFVDADRHTITSELYRRAWDVGKANLGEEHPGVLACMTNLAWSLNSQGRYPEAQELGEQALEVQKRVLSEEHPKTLKSMSDLAVSLSEQDKYAEAQPLIERVVEVQIRVLGEEHPDTRFSIDILVWVKQKIDQAS